MDATGARTGASGVFWWFCTPETEIALCKLKSAIDQRTHILQIAEHYNAKVVDYGAESLVLRVFGSSEKLNAFVELLRPYGVEELVRSGKIVMARGLLET